MRKIALKQLWLLLVPFMLLSCKDRFDEHYEVPGWLKGSIWATLEQDGNYSIFLDEKANILYGYIELSDPQRWSESAETEICRKWWEYMADIMETNPDNSPVAMDLKEVFHLD